MRDPGNEVDERSPFFFFQLFFSSSEHWCVGLFGSEPELHTWSLWQIPSTWKWHFSEHFQCCSKSLNDQAHLVLYWKNISPICRSVKTSGWYFLPVRPCTWSIRYIIKINFFEWMNECVFIYHTYHIMSHGGLQCYWVRSDVSLWRRLWLPLSVHIWSHSPTQPMHEMCNETTDRPQHQELRALLFSISVWVL